MLSSPRERDAGPASKRKKGSTSPMQLNTGLWTFFRDCQVSCQD